MAVLAARLGWFGPGPRLVAGKEEGPAPVGADPSGENRLCVSDDRQRRNLLRRGCEMSLAISHDPALYPIRLRMAASKSCPSSSGAANASAAAPFHAILHLGQSVSHRNRSTGWYRGS